jgi:hypothetical protein
MVSLITAEYPKIVSVAEFFRMDVLSDGFGDFRINEKILAQILINV